MIFKLNYLNGQLIFLKNLESSKFCCRIFLAGKYSNIDYIFIYALDLCGYIIV